MSVHEDYRIGSFGHVSRGAAGATIFERVVTTGSLVVREIGGDRAGEMSAHRFLGSPHVTPEEIIATAGTRTAAACTGRRIVVAQDTTEINFSGRDRGRKGLGPAGDGKSLGFFCHAAVAVDVAEVALAVPHHPADGLPLLARHLEQRRHQHLLARVREHAAATVALHHERAVRVHVVLPRERRAPVHVDDVDVDAPRPPFDAPQEVEDAGVARVLRPQEGEDAHVRRQVVEDLPGVVRQRVTPLRRQIQPQPAAVEDRLPEEEDAEQGGQRERHAQPLRGGAQRRPRHCRASRTRSVAQTNRPVA